MLGFLSKYPSRLITFIGRKTIKSEREMLILWNIREASDSRKEKNYLLNNKWVQIEERSHGILAVYIIVMKMFQGVRQVTL